MNLRKFRRELEELSKEYPNDNLWSKMFALLDKWEAELRQPLKELQKRKTFSLGDVVFARILKIILGEG